MEFLVPEIQAGIGFYTRLLGRPPDFDPHEDFKEWEVLPGCWLLVGHGEPRPAYPMRLCVEDIEAAHDWVEHELGVSCSPIRRIPGLVALCDFSDRWGTNLGFYQRLFVDGVPRVPGGSHHDNHYEH